MSEKTTQTTQFDLLTTTEACQMLRVSRMTLHRLVQAGELRRVRVRARCVRFQRREVERFVERKTRG